jgi:F-type H+-transporting ATPase subunit a
LVKIDIANKNLARLFEVNGTAVHLTESMVATWIVMAILIIFAVIVRIKIKKFTEVPTGKFQNAVEALVEMLSSFTKNALGEKLEFLGAYFFGAFVFIILSNYIGLIPGVRSPTTDLATTAPLAVSTFILIHFNGMRFRKGKYFKEYLSPFPVFLPLNILGECARPLSLALRLFGNILGGLIIIELMYGMMPIAAQFLTPIIAHGFFDLFAGFLQAFVFTMLSMTFIRVKATED